MTTIRFTVLMTLVLLTLVCGTCPTTPPAVPTPSPNGGGTTPQPTPNPDPPAVPTPNPPDQNALAQPPVLAPLLFNVGKSVGVLSDEVIELLADAVFEATDQNGGVQTLTGTLTQVVNGETEAWTYDAAPADALVVELANGQITEFRITQFEGETAQGAAGLAWGRHALVFDVIRANVCNLHIVSTATPTVSYTSSWERQLSGEAALRGYTLVVDLVYTGERYWEIVGVVEDLSDEAKAQGVAQTGDLTIEVDDAFYFQYNGQVTTTTANFSIGTSSSAQIAGRTYAFDWDGNRAGVRWEGTGTTTRQLGVWHWIDFGVYDDAYWTCGGALYEGGQRLGDVEFSGPVVPFTQGPDLLLRLTDGTDVLLHDLFAE